MYEHGYGTEKDPEKALHWTEVAAKKGYKHAQYNMAVYYSKGEFSPKYPKMSYVQYILSFSNENEKAIKPRDDVWSSLSASDQSTAHDMAKEYFKEYAEPFTYPQE